MAHSIFVFKHSDSFFLIDWLNPTPRGDNCEIVQVLLWFYETLFFSLQLLHQLQTNLVQLCSTLRLKEANTYSSSRGSNAYIGITQLPIYFKILFCSKVQIKFCLSLFIVGTANQVRKVAQGPLILICTYLTLDLDIIRIC